MSIRVEVLCVNAAGSEPRREVLSIERSELAMETLGMTLEEGKALLAGVQDFVVGQQAQEHLERHRECPHCGARYTSKDSGSTAVSTVFGRVEVPNPRWNRCVPHGRHSGSGYDRDLLQNELPSRSYVKK